MHGTTGSPENFGDSVRELRKLGAPIFAPRYGQHGTDRLADCIADLEPLVEMATQASPAGQIDIVGHSYGGQIALHLASRYPVRTLVGVGPAYRGAPYLKRNRLLPTVLGIVAGPAFPELMNPNPAPVPEVTGTRIVSIISPVDHTVPKQSSLVGEVIELTDPIPHALLPYQTDVILEHLDWQP